ncbi:TonB-dependent receptor plug domain-containing protein [Bacteroides zhangwenhongii]|jgi:vitamin B12 transporter|uniref:TonB-dependent receptor plug domain-containing protein n=1 Tax=Bacteroides zhangwenhongii TaxID=2650157 RepID=UPI0022E0A33A|nr:TonB-dependent receptor [Bacteroides zhangwenhongii]
MEKRTLAIFAVSCNLFLSTSLFAQEQRVDTARTYYIPEITVSDIYQTREVRSTAPLQIFSKDALKNLNALQVSDAVKHFAGVTVKDYGGIGGLKTISIRSLGAQHTAVGYDGITLTDCQTGQIDLGRFSLDNVDQLSLSNGQSDNIFQPARFFASAGILNIQTLTPQFEDGKRTNISASFKTGSWGLVNPSLLLEQRISRKWTVSANGEWMSSDGHYPYTLYYGNEEGDLSSREKRKNTDVQTFRAEAGLYGNFSDKEQWRLKAYYFQSSRGLPNATTFYYTHSSQRLWDKNTFIQSQYKKEFNRQWVFQTSAKWNWSYQRYLDPDYKGSTGEIENSYYQQEYYLSGAVLYRLLNNLSFSLSSDGSINTMNANLNDFAHPTRYSWLTAFAGKYVNNWLTLSASALATVIYEQADKGGSAGNHRKLSPYVSASFKPFDKEEFRIRIFYKDIFRLPSFNDLYYGETGNNKLKPENARQYNIGLTYSKDVCPFLPYLSATVDAYYNKITDKIIAYPTKNLAVWSMRNLGSVEIKGIDVTGNVSLQPCEKFRINLSGNYTYQRALDVTNSDPASEEGRTYKHQIAYTPRVSGSGQVGIETFWVNLSYSFLLSGKRYAVGQNIAANRLDSYSDHSISASRDFRIKKVTTSLSVEILNIMNKNYEIVKSFPMPGRSVRATFSVRY